MLATVPAPNSTSPVRGPMARAFSYNEYASDGRFITASNSAYCTHSRCSSGYVAVASFRITSALPASPWFTYCCAEFKMASIFSDDAPAFCALDVPPGDEAPLARLIDQARTPMNAAAPPASSSSTSTTPPNALPVRSSCARFMRLHYRLAYTRSAMSGQGSQTPNTAAPHAASADAPALPGELPKQYRPADHEPKVWQRWIDANAFHADPNRVLRGEARPYCVLIPPPNVTAALHLGHALNNTLQDVLVRAHRMMGYETLWMPGTDHAGIATQAVVEKRLRKEGKLKGALKQSMQREEFVAQVQAFKDEYEAVITGQLKAMGCSCDWSRQRFTMDEICTRAVREAFFRLFTDGLIYRGKRLVNWDPALQTAVADDECYDEDVDSFFYFLKYPLVRGGATERRSDGATEGSEPLTWGELARAGCPG